ncbi:FdrA family protein [Nonomuraea soli]|uniref:FdrA protein n=1 Tax=Nonomuraea soli TaxID=1032476 RepID=A0A7W0CP02_9ACTN|nr:FdrA family protein [Nonomuraea soli]MBA2894588.1 FdrA protein [Nonomuraea soli]
MNELVTLRRGIYHDSVSLMRVSKALSDLPGVEVAIVAMATTLNVGLARDLGFEVPACEPSDLLVAVRADDPAAAADELDRLLDALSRQSAAQAADLPPRTTRAAARSVPAGLALVSVPGEHAFAEALDALEAGLNVMIFSDGVSLEQEVRLKALARAAGLLVMGPDCGTAVIAGAGLGFANVLKPGPVGVVAASGTGAQHVTCLLDRAGVGITHVLGVGGRDLSAEVGGLATIQALRMLDADPATELIVLISKPPDPSASATVQAVVAELSTPVVQAMLGATDLTSATAEALRVLGRAVPEWPSWEPDSGGRAAGGRLLGLFSGGTLCQEARLVAGHGDFTDFGDDAYTRGRAHPMIDPSLRLEALDKAEEGDTVLMDVVLGHGADPDPAATLAPAIAAAPARVVVCLVGTEGDPQGLGDQVSALTRAGAWVFTSNADAARFAGGGAR